MNNVLAIYDKVAKDIATYYDGQTHLDPIKEFTLPLKKNSRILDIGCGMGKDVHFFSNLGFDAQGVDGSTGMIKEARNRYPDEKFNVSNINNLKFPDNYFDAVWSWSVLTHLNYDGKKDAMKKINQLLRNNGIFTQTIWRGRGNFVNYDVYPRPHYLLSIPSWRKLYKESGFTDLNVKIIKSSWRDSIRVTAKKTV